MKPKFNHKEVLKYFKWKTRKKIKKHEKRKKKNPDYKKVWDDFVDDIDQLLLMGAKK